MPAEAIASVRRRHAGLAGGAVGRWAIVLLCLVPAGAYYAWAISLASPDFFAQAPRGLTFNSMLLHLMHGAFNVDAQTIGDEGVIRDGKVYSYFGILPALLRAPFLLSADFAYTDYTRLSCVAAVCVMAGAKLAAAVTLWQISGRPERSRLVVLFAIAILLGGAQIQFLRGMIYQEVVSWAAALAAVFVYLVIAGIAAERGFGGGRLTALAAMAGLCLLTRVSTAVGLFASLGLLWLSLVWQALRAEGFRRLPEGAAARFLPAVVTLAAFAVITGIVNEQRWGNPFVFTEPQNYLWAMIHGPDRLARAATYGLFNPLRIGYGLMYYFCPVWVLQTGDGKLLWAAFQNRTIDAVELPPSSFFLSDPLLIGLAIFALVQLATSRAAIARHIAIPILIGLAMPVALILCFASMTFRYRLEFYPFFEFCALLGFGVLLSRPAEPPYRRFALAAFAGVAAAHLFAVLYMLSPLGDATGLLEGRDVISYYRAAFH